MTIIPRYVYIGQIHTRRHRAVPLHLTQHNTQFTGGEFHQRVAAPLPAVGAFEAWNVGTAASFDVCHRPSCRKDPQMVPNGCVGLCEARDNPDPPT